MKILVVMSCKSFNSFSWGNSQDGEVTWKILFLEFQIGLSYNNKTMIRNAPEKKKKKVSLAYPWTF